MELEGALHPSLEGALHPSFNGPLWPGKRVFFHYNHGQGDMWHERLLLCQSHRSFWAILTPDDDIVCEDVDELMWCPSANRQVPRALSGRTLYRFVDSFFAMPEEELRQLFMFRILTALRCRRAAGVQGQPPSPGGIRAALAAPGIMAACAARAPAPIAAEPEAAAAAAAAAAVLPEAAAAAAAAAHAEPRRGVLVAGAPEAAEQPAATPEGAAAPAEPALGHPSCAALKWGYPMHSMCG